MSDASRGPCRNCGDAWGHHQGDETCWGPSCNVKPRDQRCVDYDPAPPKVGADDGPSKPPTPPKKAPRADLVARPSPTDGAEEEPARPEPPREGTAKRDVYDLVLAAGSRGLTDDEIVQQGTRTRAVVTRSRQALFSDGLLRDSGARRAAARGGNDSAAWVVVVADDDPGLALAFTPRHGLVRKDVTLESTTGGVLVITAGDTSFRITPAPGDPVEMTVRARSKDDADEREDRLLIVLDESAEKDLYERIRNASDLDTILAHLRTATLSAQAFLQRALLDI